MDRLELVEKNLALANWVARRYWKWSRTIRRIGTLRDVQQEAVLGLIAAARGFDTDFGCAFSTYAVKTIRRRLWRAALRSGPIAVPTSALQASEAIQKRARLALRPLWPIEDAVDHHAEETGAVRATRETFETYVRPALRFLPSREREVLLRRFGLAPGEPYLEAIGRDLGLTKERVRQLEARARRMLSRYLAPRVSDELWE